MLFIDRTTAIGEIINNFLTKKIELPSETIHLLFSANRWECKDDILKTLQKGTTLIIDRQVINESCVIIFLQKNIKMLKF